MPNIEVPTPVIEKDAKNGVTHPRENTFAGYVWVVADAVQKWREEQKFEHTVPVFQEVFDAITSQMPNAVRGTVSMHLSKWYKYHGLKDALAARRDYDKRINPIKRNMSPEKAVEKYVKLFDRYSRFQSKADTAKRYLDTHVVVMKELGLDVPEMGPITDAPTEPVEQPEVNAPAEPEKEKKASKKKAA